MSGSFLLDAVYESHGADDLRDLLVGVQPTPALLGGFDEAEHPCQAGPAAAFAVRTAVPQMQRRKPRFNRVRCAAAGSARSGSRRRSTTPRGGSSNTRPLWDTRVENLRRTHPMLARFLCASRRKQMGLCVRCWIGSGALGDANGLETIVESGSWRS